MVSGTKRTSVGFRSRGPKDFLTKILYSLVSLCAVVMPSLASACAVCFGDPESKQTQSAMAGVLFMFGITLFVLGTIGSVAFTWARRAKALEQAQASLTETSH